MPGNIPSTSCVITPRLSALHRRSIAVRVAMPGHDELLVGRGIYEQDAELGAILRIELPTEETCEIVLIEGAFAGEILPGKPHGCDYLIRLS